MQALAIICVILAFTIFHTYNGIVVSRFGVPESLSDSFYLLNSAKKDLGYLFTAMMFTVAFTLLPGWIEISEHVSSWSTYLTPLAFFTCGSVCFVGAAPAFRNGGMEEKVHTYAAYVCAASALLWDFIVCWKIMYVPALVIGLVIGIGCLTKTFKSCLIYWLEMCAFYATFITIAVQLILLIS